MKGTKNNDIFIAFLSLLYLFIFTEFSTIECFGISLFIYVLFRFLNNLGNTIPVREFAGFLLTLQYIITPLITYRYLNNDGLFVMDMPEQDYFSYIVPASFAFISGLFYPYKRKRLSDNNFSDDLNIFEESRYKTGIYLIVIGFVAKFAGAFLPGSLSFIFYLLKQTTFIGILYIMFSGNKNWGTWFGVVMFLFVLEIFAKAVFYDLFVWGGFMSMYLFIKYKKSLRFKIIAFSAGLFLAYFIQSVKFEYRDIVWANKNVNTFDAFVQVSSKSLASEKGFFSNDKIDMFVSRLNFGWIMAKVLNQVPKHEPFVNGELFKNDIAAVLLPRFIATNKTKVGGKENREKFTKYTGRILQKGTTIRIGIIADGYINFARTGSFIFMFLLGFFFNFVFYKFNILAQLNPNILLWLPFSFSYVVRLSDFVVLMNFFIKATLLIMLLFWASKKFFNVKL